MTRRRVLVTLCVWLVLSISLEATGGRPAVLVLGGIVAVVATVILVMLDLAHTVIQVEWTRQRHERRSTGGSDLLVSSLHHQLYGARWSGSTELRDTLVELIDDRLLVHRQIDRATDAAEAMEALTPTLRRLVASPRRPATEVRELNRILTDIEAL